MSNLSTKTKMTALNAWRRFKNCTRAEGNLVATVIIVIASIAIGAIVLASIEGAIPNVTSTIANTTITGVFNTGWSSYQMLPVITIIVVAGAIFGYLRFFGGGGK
ncbi:MAG: hypothetical protein LBC12_01825 [Nitrososphaerota archaeon]|jgi:ABC-type multidrug transport system permease subunit|nr:hypothetical protein [Nitrososphaerota archaeon]